MQSADPAFDFVPCKSGGRVACEVCLPSFQFLDLPVVDRNRLRIGREVVSKVFDELKFFGGAQIKNRWRVPVHLATTRLALGKPRAFAASAIRCSCIGVWALPMKYCGSATHTLNATLSSGPGYSKRMELVFEIRAAEEGGYCARALGHSIFTEGETWEELRANVLEAAVLHFEDAEVRPSVVQLHYVKDELIPFEAA
jgi:hypothetical protein